MSEAVGGYINWPRVEAIVYGEEPSPKDVLAPRIVPEGILVQGFFPGAQDVVVVNGKKSFPMEKCDQAGYFAALIPGRKIPEYFYRVTKDGEVRDLQDPYAQPILVTEANEKAFLAGTWYEAGKVLGAHYQEVNGVKGTLFALWAPNARRVSLVGEFNHWDGRALPLHKSPMTGIFSLFVPEIGPGEAYLYELLLSGGSLALRMDPYARESRRGECRGLPMVSVVPKEEEFPWEDAAYLSRREGLARVAQPRAILEANPVEFPSLDALADQAIAQGYNYVELTPVMEFLDDRSVGYSTAAYFSITDRIGGSDALKAFVNRLHIEGIGVILDWTPAQFPKIVGGMRQFDGTPLYEVPNPHRAVHPKWDTMLYNYDSPMVHDFLISNALYYLDVFHMDGLRFDDVDAMLYLDYGRAPGQWSANLYGGNENLGAVRLLQQIHRQMERCYPGTFTIAQEDGLWPELTSKEEDKVGFDYKWSGGFTKDFLGYLYTDPILRKNVHDQLTLSMLYSYCEHFVLTLGRRDIGSPLALANSVPVPDTCHGAQLREAFTYLYMHPGIKMTCAQLNPPEDFTAFLKDLNEVYLSTPALYKLDNDFDGFEWVQLTKYEENVVAFLRKTEEEDETILVVANFAAVPYRNYRVGVPFHGTMKEIFNSDQVAYGGTGVVNGVRESEPIPCDERDDSIKLNLGALGVAVFACTRT